MVAVTEDSVRESVPERWNAIGTGSDLWMDMAQDPRFAAGAELEGERATLLDYLRAHRLTMEMKCADLDAAQLARRSVPPSTMSLLGLVRHMADVERNWFRRVMAQADAPPLYWSEDVADADWLGAVADPAIVDDAWRAWREEVAFAEKFVADSPDLGIKGIMRDGTSIALREVLVHMIEESLREPGQSHGHTLDFTLRHRQSGRLYAAEMKCWITWANYRYLRLTEAAQLIGLAEPAFVKFLALARDRAAYQVFVGGKPVHVDGVILVWGAATEPGRSAAVALGVADVLTVEDMVSDLHVWQPPGWQDFIARRRSWATDLFDYLG